MSSHSTTIQFKSILHQVLKMTPFCSYTGGESRMPLIYRFVYDVLSNAVPHTRQALTQLLHYSPDLIIHGVHIWAVWGHWSREIKSGVSRRKSAIVSRALCAGALSYWNMKLSPDISQGSAATDLRWGENFNKFLFRNSLLYIAVKKITKIGQYLPELSQK